MTNIQIRENMLPKDGRFGSGPSLVPDVAIQKLASEARKFIGNSHRQANIKNLVARFQDNCRQLFGLPDEWAIVMGNGGTSLLWDALSFCAIRSRSQHLSFGEFSSRFAQIVADSPYLKKPEVLESPLGICPVPIPNPKVDFYALTHNETSTGVVSEIIRPRERNASKYATDGALVAVDATSAAGAIMWDPQQADIYYFSLQKGFAADGGLWVACCAPAAIERFQELDRKRWCPKSLNLELAYQNSIKNQTLNTPAIATIYLATHYSDWVLENGGLDWAAARSKKSSDTIYEWADQCDWATPFVINLENRSPVVATIDLDEAIPASEVSQALRENGIVDTEPYRKLNRNQLRFGVFPARDPEDVEALCISISYIVDKFFL